VKELKIKLKYASEDSLFKDACIIIDEYYKEHLVSIKATLKDVIKAIETRKKQ
jgi:hypothetical protein